MASIQGIYIALFGRPADPLGLDYFNAETQNGANLSNIQGLTGTAEYLDRFEGQNNVQIVTSIYQELFGRNPDAAGLAYFVASLNSGEQTIETIAINILDGARDADAELVAAKVAAADQFTAAVRADADALARYQGETGIAFGQAFIDQITSADVELTDDQVEAQVGAFGDGNPDIPGLPTVPGTIFTLTDDADVITGTANSDTIRALGADTLGTEDVIDGGAGFDTLNISDGAIAGPLVGGGNAAPVISNVERINNSDNGTSGLGASASTLNLSAVTGLQQLWSVGSGGNNAFIYTNASLATVFGSSASAATGTGNVTVNVDYAGSLSGDTTAKLATDRTAGTVTFDFGTDATDIESVEIDIAGSGGAVALDAGLTDVDSVVVTGAGDSTVTLGAGVTASIETFDASASTGDLTIAIGATAVDLASVSTGSGSDTITVALGEVDLVVNAGAGSDTVSFDASNPADVDDAVSATITLGAGNDTLLFSAIGNLSADAETDAEIEASLVTVTDFVRGEDTIDIADFAAFADQAGADGVNAAIADAETLAEAVEALRDEGFAAAQFLFDETLYLYNDGGAGNDTLIELAGVTTLLTAADFA